MYVGINKSRITLKETNVEIKKIRRTFTKFHRNENRKLKNEIGESKRIRMNEKMLKKSKQIGNRRYKWEGRGFRGKFEKEVTCTRKEYKREAYSKQADFNFQRLCENVHF